MTPCYRSAAGGSQWSLGYCSGKQELQITLLGLLIESMIDLVIERLSEDVEHADDVCEVDLVRAAKFNLAGAA